MGKHILFDMIARERKYQATKMCKVILLTFSDLVGKIITLWQSTWGQQTLLPPVPSPPPCTWSPSHISWQLLQVCFVGLYRALFAEPTTFAQSKRSQFLLCIYLTPLLSSFFLNFDFLPDKDRLNHARLQNCFPKLLIGSR